MASFSTSLEQGLRRALQYANERSHEYATLEHLLLSLIDDRDAAAVISVRVLFFASNSVCVACRVARSAWAVRSWSMVALSDSRSFASAGLG